MYAYDYLKKLQKCNSKFVIGSPYPGFIGLCLNKPAEWDKVLTSNLSLELYNIVTDFNSGYKIEAILPIDSEFPEYSQYNIKTRKRIVRGWQDITHFLVTKNLITVQSAMKHLRYNKLADWHKCTPQERIDKCLH